MRDLDDPTNRDTVPAMLTPGEFVLNKEASQMFAPHLEAMNQAGLQARQAGNHNMGGQIPGGYNVGGLVDFLKKEEGWRDTAYEDSGGVWTIGYGRTTNPDGSKVKKGQKTNKEKEDAWLEKRATKDYDATKAYLDKHGYDYSDGQLTSLSSFRYNGGQGMLEQLTDHGQRDWNTIKTKFPQYNKVTDADGNKVPVKGLTNRRNAELGLWGDTSQEVPPQATPPDQGVPGGEGGFPGVADALGMALGGGQPMVQSMAPAQPMGVNPEYIPSVAQGGVSSKRTNQQLSDQFKPPKTFGTWNGGGPVVQLNEGGWWDRLFGKEKKKQNEIVAVDPFQGTVTYANGEVQVDPNKAKIQATTAGPAQPAQQYTPSPLQPTPPGYEPRLGQGMKGGGILDVPTLQGVPPVSPQAAPAAPAPTIRDQLSGSLRRSWDERHNRVDAPPVPGSDEALLQGSSQAIEAQEDAGLPPTIGAAPTPPPPPTDLSGMSPEEIGALYDQGDPAAIAYAENEENQWRVGEELNQNRLNQAVQAPETEGAEFNRQREEALQRQLSQLQGTPEGAQVAQNQEGAQLTVPQTQAPVRPDAWSEATLPQDVQEGIGGVNLPSDLAAPSPPGGVDPRGEGKVDQATGGPGEQKRKATTSEQHSGLTAGLKGVVEKADQDGEPPAPDVSETEVIAAGQKAGQGMPVEEKKKMAGQIRQAFGDIFDQKEMVRMGVLMLGAMATGMSPGRALAFAGTHYLQRVDAKEAGQQKHFQDLVKNGKYTTQSVAAYQESGDPADLMLAEQAATLKQTGQFKEMYSNSGQRIQAQQVETADGSKIWVDKNNKPVNLSQVHTDASRAPGTPEYRERVQKESKQYKDTFSELQERFGKFEGDGGQDFYTTDLTPSKVGLNATKWALKNGVPPEAMGQLLDNAYQSALNDSRGGKKARNITAYLNEQYIKSQVGDPSLFKNQDGEAVAPEKVNMLMNAFGNQLKGLPGYKGLSSTAITSTVMQKARPMWAALGPDVKKKYEQAGQKAGTNGFMAYLQQQLSGSI